MNRLFTIVFLTMIAVLASATALAFCEHGQAENYNGYLPPIEDDDNPFLVFEVDCSKSGRITAQIYEKPLDLINRVDRRLVYRDAKGRTWRIELEKSRVGKIGFGRLNLTVKRGDKILLHHRLSSNILFDVNNPACFSRHGDGGFLDGQLLVTFPRSKTTSLAELATSRGWQAWKWQDDKKVIGNELFFSPGICEKTQCKILVDVGPGAEFSAMATINASSPETCASWLAGGAGSPPIQVAGITLATFTNPEAPSPAQTARLIKEKILGSLFIERVDRTELRVIGRGHRFGFSLVGPAAAMGVGLSRDYWYKADLAMEVGINVHSGDVSESMVITILDLFEIRAPASLDRLPDALIRSGRQMDYIDPESRQFGRDGQIMQGWLEALATRIASIIGGKVVGGY